MIELLRKEWHNNLNSLICEAKKNIFISSPYVTKRGVTFIQNQFSNEFKNTGKLTFLTNLSSSNIIQGSINPEVVFKQLMNTINDFDLWHLPKLHAKVYISDKSKSIITSGNLTNGGLFSNFEYGIQIDNKEESNIIYNDIYQYCQLGSKIDIDTLNNIISVSSKIITKREKQDNVIKTELNDLLNTVDSELVKNRLNVGATHNVFSKTILYILQKYGSLSTENIHI